MGLRVTLLPTCHGSESQLQPLTTFLVNGRIAVDAGSLGLAVEPSVQREITDVIITHPHIDHTGGLPVHIAAAYTTLTRPVRIYATDFVIDALRTHLFNEVMWPDFTQIPLVNSDRPAMEYVAIGETDEFEVAGLRVSTVPVNHTVPTVGLRIESDNNAIAFTSDTYLTDEIWKLAGRAANMRAVFVDCSYPDELEWLAERSGHLTPKLIVDEMKKMERAAQVFAVHIKPADREKVLEEIAALNCADFTSARIGKEYSW